MFRNHKYIVSFTAIVFSSIIMLPTFASADTLSNQINSLQQRTEQVFEEAPSIVERVYSSPTSETLVDYSDLQDSALLTGTYLASQCFREAAAVDPQDKMDAEVQIQWALGSIENLFDVTGTPGLLARFAFNTSDLNLNHLAFAKSASVKSGWTKSKTFPGWFFMGNTSRDQYTAVLFGLGMCNQLSTNADIKVRTAVRISAALTLLSHHDWTIPGCTGTAGEISIDTQASWLKLAALSSTTDSERLDWETQYKNTMNYLMTNLTEEIETELNPTIINNYEEYYAWNLGYMRVYPQLLLETNSTYLDYLRNNMTTKMWNETWNQGNSEFTFMKIGTMGVQSSNDKTALSQALESLDQLAVRNRRDFPIHNSPNSVGGFNTTITGLTSFISTLGISSTSFVDPLQAANPIPMTNRVPNDDMWQQSPFQLSGGGKGTIEAPSVDTIFAYWLGQFHHLLSGQAVTSVNGSTVSGTGTTASTSSHTNTGQSTTGATSTGTNTTNSSGNTGTNSGANPGQSISTYSGPSWVPNHPPGGGYEIFKLLMTGVNYVGTLNYHGKPSTYTESAQALDQSYSAVVQASSMFFTNLQADVLKLVNDEANKLPGSHTTSVQLGDSMALRMKGQGTYSNVSIQLPTISADVGVKIEKLWGLIVITCNESVVVSNAVITGHLNIATGALTGIGIHGDPTARTQCSNNIPIFGFIVSDLLDHFAEKAITPTLARFNGPAGYPIKSDNFGGVNKLLKPGTFVVNGLDYGSTLCKDLVNFFNKSEVNIGVYNPQPLRPAGGPYDIEKTSTFQPLFTLNLPNDNISLNIQEQELYSPVGIWRSGKAP